MREMIVPTSVGTISVISSTPIMPMLVLSVIPESCCDHGLWEALTPLRSAPPAPLRGTSRGVC